MLLSERVVFFGDEEANCCCPLVDGCCWNVRNCKCEVAVGITELTTELLTVLDRLSLVEDVARFARDVVGGGAYCILLANVDSVKAGVEALVMTLAGKDV